jgi:hypothetical protein
VSKFSHYEQCPRCLEKGKDSRGDNLGVYGDGSKHCYACGYHIFPKHHIPKEVNEHENKAVLPADFTREVPGEAWKWLLQWGLSFRYWKEQGVGWSEKDRRLVFTVGSEFSIGRFIPRPGEPLAIPKQDEQRQLNVIDRRAPRKWFVWGDCHKIPHVYGDYQTSERVVLVEDIISAHKVAGAGYTGIPLFGVNVFPSIINTLRHIKLPVTYWLDKDQEHTMRDKANNLALLTGLPVSFRVSVSDPKALSFEKIRSIL